jgi:aspartyl-tRNA(Asn)/glutamyl-tRNA(Gln) amidotransferase subunit A
LSSSIINPIRNVIRGLRDLGASIVPVSLPSTSYALSSYYVLASAEASSNLARYDGIQYGELCVDREFRGWWDLLFISQDVMCDRR